MTNTSTNDTWFQNRAAEQIHLEQLKSAERFNGRAAMLGIVIGIITEAITGIQTIKSQNAELKTRWEFQNRYARFLGEDLKLKVSQETLGNLAEFIQTLNQVLLLAVGR